MQPPRLFLTVTKIYTPKIEREPEVNYYGTKSHVIKYSDLINMNILVHVLMSYFNPVVIVVIICLCRAERTLK
jgi:hypothetical protein